MTQTIGAWDNSGTLKPFEKLEVHKSGLKHPAVSVFVATHNEILIQRRALNKYHTPGLWANTVCTHPHWNEPILDCATRRLSEELNITGIKLTFQSEIEYRAEVGNGLIEHEVVSIFLAKSQKHRQLLVNHNPAEVHETKWVSLTDLLEQINTLPDSFTPWFKIYMLNHSQKILE